MALLNILLETCATLTKQVSNLEQDKVAQAIEITKLKQRVRSLEKKRQFKSTGLKRLRKVGTAQRVESSADTVINDQEDASKQGGIAELDADKDVTLEDVDVKVVMDADVQGRLVESQVKVYHLDLEHTEKFLSMQDIDEAEPAKVEEVIEVVTTAKLMTEVVTIAATTITASQVPKASAPKRMKGVVIQDPEEIATASVIVHSKDEAFARQLAELNANINWNNVVDQVKRKEKQDNTVMRYQALKRKPHYNSIQEFLEKGEKEIEEEGSKTKDDSLEQKAAKKQRIDEEEEELKAHLQIVADDVFTEATPLATKVHIVDYQIHHKNNKPYYKIIRADGTHKLFLSFITILKNFDRDDLEMLWKLVQERFQSSEPNNFLDDFLLNTLKTIFEKPNVEDVPANLKEIPFDTFHSRTNAKQCETGS
nr:hypothetical protein [Tanacetum cinerariifolium]